MKRHLSILVVLVVLGFASNLVAQPKAPRRLPGSIAFSNAKVYSMDGSNTRYQSILITDGKIAKLTNDPIESSTPLPPNATIFPGFIDSHSHAISLLSARVKDRAGKPYWKNLGNVNVMLLPPCGNSTPDGSVDCFGPVTTQADVERIIRAAQPNAAGWILGWNYEPSRMTCTVTTEGVVMTKYGFDCPNFENQTVKTARQQLDDIRADVPMLIATEAGHIAYVNTPALEALNICGVSNDENCAFTPIQNVATETALAKTGQLDEDIALYAIEHAMSAIARNYAGDSSADQMEFMAQQIRASLDLYSQLGYTTVQEGAAGTNLILTYINMAMDQEPPVRMALLAYDNTSPPAKFPDSAFGAYSFNKVLRGLGLDMFIAGMKAYADGSTQGWTGYMQAGQYQNPKKAFTDSKIFPQQPYRGLPDYNKNALVMAASVANNLDLPLWVHTNGTAAQSDVLGAIKCTKPDQGDCPRNVIVHFAMPTQTQVQAVPTNVGATFLANDFYYYYQPLCEQIVGTANSTDLYPAKWAADQKIPFGLHSDASVTPPSPLFSVWVASERPQQNPWSTALSGACAQQQLNQRISRLDALRAYTNNAAWLYSRDTTKGNTPGLGSLQPGFAGDLVVLSDDPLDVTKDLSKIYVLYTIKDGNIVYPKTGTGWATSGPPWPK